MPEELRRQPELLEGVENHEINQETMTTLAPLLPVAELERLYRNSAREDPEFSLEDSLEEVLQRS